MRQEISLSTDTRMQTTKLYAISAEKIYFNGKRILAIFRVNPIDHNILGPGRKIDYSVTVDLPGVSGLNEEFPVERWLLSDLPIHAEAANIIPTKSADLIITAGFKCIYPPTNCIKNVSFFQEFFTDNRSTSEDLKELADLTV